MVTALSEALESEGFRVASIQRPPSITEEERNLRNLSIPLNNNLGCSAIVARPLTSSACGRATAQSRRGRRATRQARRTSIAIGLGREGGTAATRITWATGSWRRWCVTLSSRRIGGCDVRAIRATARREERERACAAVGSDSRAATAVHS